jgi:hypothetical protein
MVTNDNSIMVNLLPHEKAMITDVAEKAAVRANARVVGIVMDDKIRWWIIIIQSLDEEPFMDYPLTYHAFPAGVRGNFEGNEQAIEDSLYAEMTKHLEG